MKFHDSVWIFMVAEAITCWVQSLRHHSILVLGVVAEWANCF